MLEVLFIIGLALVCLLGTAATALKLPGTWLIVISAFVWSWLANWSQSSLIVASLILFAAVVGEVLETIASAVMAKRAGASKEAAWGGLIGGFLGIFLFAIPLFLIGSIIGAMLGCFVGAMIGELIARNELRQGSRAGLFAVAGFVLGSAAKVLIAFWMSVLLLGLALCSPAKQIEQTIPTIENEAPVQAITE